jgi:hypothetical protein
MVTNYNKRSYNIPTLSIPRPSKIYPNWDFWPLNKPSGNPVLQLRLSRQTFGSSKDRKSGYISSSPTKLKSQPVVGFKRWYDAAYLHVRTYVCRGTQVRMYKIVELCLRLRVNYLCGCVTTLSGRFKFCRMCPAIPSFNAVH